MSALTTESLIYEGDLLMQQVNGNEVTALVDIYGSNVFNDSVMRQTLPKGDLQVFEADD